jgi:sugar phosphate isomerase/epimerase
MKSHPSPAPNSSRRHFLAQLAAASATVPLAPFAPSAFAAESKKKSAGGGAPALPPWTGGPTVIHVFSKPLHWMSFADTAALAKATGYGGIDYTVRVAQGHVLPEKVKEDLPRAIDAAHAAGLKVELMTTDITGVQDKHAETVLRTAAKLGVKYYRTGNFKYDPKLSVMESLGKLKPALKELAALNASLGIHGAIQNHAGTGVGAAIWDTYELLRDIDPRGLGIQYDLRHAVVEGAQAWPVTLKLLAPWIKCTDMKDFKWEQTPGKATIENVPIGEGIVPFDAYFKLVRELKISGPMSMHLEYAPFERSQISEAEKRAQFPALMKKDLVSLKALMAKQGLS